MIKIYFIIATLLMSICASAQEDTLRLSFAPRVASDSLIMDELIMNAASVTVFKCYVGQISLWQNDSLVLGPLPSYHLLDVEDSSSLDLVIPIAGSPEYNRIEFSLGVDSTTSVSGAFGGDLDPIHGMYWAWNSGYINTKLEGFIPITVNTVTPFNFHLGGYLPPYATAQTLSFDTEVRAQHNFNIELGNFIQQLDLESNLDIMSPGAEALRLSQLFATSFRLINE